MEEEGGEDESPPSDTGEGCQPQSIVLEKPRMNARSRLFFAAAVLVTAAALISLFVPGYPGGARAGIAQADLTPTAEVSPTPAPGAPCAECHLDVVAQWQGSTHALAYTEPKFAAAWEKVRDTGDNSCLGCHTTGFSARTGEFLNAGVTCEACHGSTPALHPPEAVTLNKGVEMCAGCHITTVNEWKRSAHGEQQLACVTCHAPHDQSLRFATSDELCLNCHKDAPTQGYAHTTHLENACVDCHWYRSEDETKHILTGNLLPTGHDNQVQTRACTDCHAKEALAAAEATPAVPTTPSPAQGSLIEAQLRADELEARVNSMQAQSENLAVVRTVEGLLIGFVLGGLLMFIVYRLTFRRGHQEGQTETKP